MSTFESFGKYILLEKLATGGMAEVFLARGSGAGGIGKFFAIKRILPQYADSPEFIEMFKDEAKIAINLSHSNIVSIHEFGVEKGQFFLVMDYVEGRNLRQILNKMKKSGLQFTIDQIVYVIKEVCAGLDHAHRCIDGSTGKPLNITHRDMSPQNLMVSFEGEVKIVDFGIAKAESQLETTRAGTLKGKFGYMSPEQAEGQPVDLRTDIFSLGIVMWELLASDRLFVANNEINTLRKIRDCQIPALRKINPNIHSELERISQKALARDRNLRYQTGAALHRDLNRFLNRQYPDFSPQDFAVFIKSVFSDEIMALRKRLVDYSKVNLSNNVAAGKAFDDRTALLDTSTNSLVLSQSDAEVSVKAQKPPAASRVVKEASEPADAETKQSNVRMDARDMSPDLPVEEDSTSFVINDVTNTDANVNLPPTTASKNTKPIGFDGNPVGLPPINQSEKPGLFLDERALAAESQREVSVNKRPMNLETEEVSSPSIRGRSRSYTQHSVRPTSSLSSNSYSARFATMMIFLAVCAGGYSYLVKNQTAMMEEVLTVTDPYLHPLHVALGVPFPLSATSLSSHDRVLPGTPRPASPETAAPAPSPTPVNETNSAESPQTGFAVISNPSGAEILLNDKPTGLFTPSPLEMPPGKFDLTIRKHGYKDYNLRDLTRESVGHRLVASLVKQNVAYVDIDVFPPQEALVFINGKMLTPQSGGFHGVPVSANQNIKIRAESRNGQSYDEIFVNLPVDRRQTIQLNPRKTMRLPSSSPDQ